MTGNQSEYILYAASVDVRISPVLKTKTRNSRVQQPEMNSFLNNEQIQFLKKNFF